MRSKIPAGDRRLTGRLHRKVRKKIYDPLNKYSIRLQHLVIYFDPHTPFSVAKFQQPPFGYRILDAYVPACVSSHIHWIRDREQNENGLRGRHTICDRMGR